MHSSVSLHPMFLFGPGSISTDHLWQIRRRRRPVTKNATKKSRNTVGRSFFLPRPPPVAFSPDLLKIFRQLVSQVDRRTDRPPSCHKSSQRTI